VLMLARPKLCPISLLFYYEENMKTKKSVIELIKTRRSSRTYETRAIMDSTLKELSDYLASLNLEAKIKARFLVTSTTETSGKKMGTYGIISGASTFIIGMLDKEENDASAFGYLFEKIILKATDLGLQTCWLGGTFKKSDFEKIANIGENEKIVIVSPIGYKKEKQRMLESAMRRFAGSDNRKPWSELFFKETIASPLPTEDAGEFSVPLEMVRLGPSASNKQPWRIIIVGDVFHFFLCRTKGYWKTDFDIQKNDIGIAMCHFELSSRELGLKGSWQKLNDVAVPNEWEYISSWV